MADCTAHEAEKVECPVGKCTKKVEDKHSEEKTEVTEVVDADAENDKDVEKTDGTTLKRKSEVAETVDGADEAKKVKTDDGEESNGDKEENGKEEKTEEVAHKTIEEVQRLAGDGEQNEEVAA